MQMRPSLRTQVLFWKKRAEEAIQRSGINYTIVRPGGLTNAPRDGGLPGQIVMAGPDAFGLPPRRQPGSILRTQVQHHQHACHVLASAPHMKRITEVGNPSASKHAACHASADTSSTDMSILLSICSIFFVHLKKTVGPVAYRLQTWLWRQRSSLPHRTRWSRS